VDRDAGVIGLTSAGHDNFIKSDVDAAGLQNKTGKLDEKMRLDRPSPHARPLPQQA
jgi:hypothetical protein